MNAWKNMNLPNKLTIIRIIMVPLFMVSLMLTKNLASDVARLALYLVSAVLFLGAAITDFVDGKIARKHNLVTSFGGQYEPLNENTIVYIRKSGKTFYVYDHTTGENEEKDLTFTFTSLDTVEIIEMEEIKNEEKDQQHQHTPVAS